MFWSDILDLDEAFRMDDEEFYGRFNGIGVSQQECPNDNSGTPAASASTPRVPPGGIALNMESKINSVYPTELLNLLTDQAWPVPRQPQALQPPPKEAKAKKTQASQDLKGPGSAKLRRIDLDLEAKKEPPLTSKPKQVPKAESEKAQPPTEGFIIPKEPSAQQGLDSVVAAITSDDLVPRSTPPVPLLCVTSMEPVIVVPHGSGGHKFEGWMVKGSYGGTPKLLLPRDTALAILSARGENSTPTDWRALPTPPPEIFTPGVPVESSAIPWLVAALDPQIPNPAHPTPNCPSFAAVDSGARANADYTPPSEERPCSRGSGSTVDDLSSSDDEYESSLELEPMDELSESEQVNPSSESEGGAPPTEAETSNTTVTIEVDSSSTEGVAEALFNLLGLIGK